MGNRMGRKVLLFSDKKSPEFLIELEERARDFFYELELMGYEPIRSTFSYDYDIIGKEIKVYDEFDVPHYKIIPTVILRVDVLDKR